MPSAIVSVIVPVYNAEKWLRRCVDSILAQTYTDFELLLIDDGSNDGSGDICDEYAALDPRIHVFHKSNGGASSARNMGLDHAQGEWIAFADADDHVTPEWLLNYRVNENSDKAVICQGLTKFIQKNDNLSDIELRQDYRGSEEGNICNVLSTIFLKGMLGWLPIKALNGKYLKERKTKFDIRQRYREDEKFLLDFLRPNDKLIMYDTIGYYYQISEIDSYADWVCTPEFAQCTVANIKRLGFKPGSIIRNSFANEYKDTLLKYYKTGGENRAQLFRELTALVREEGDNIGMFHPTKFLLRYDKTGLLSRAMLRLQLLLNR